MEQEEPDLCDHDTDDMDPTTWSHNHNHNHNEDDTIMIALYYWYIPIPRTSLDRHCTFHQTLCRDLHLNGRIRISPEGINGVLSGTQSHLQTYEMKLRREMMEDNEAYAIATTTSAAPLASAASSSTMAANAKAANTKTAQGARYGETLDVKYCLLRDDLPVEKQMFTSLSCKITQEVVSLNEPGGNGNGNGQQEQQQRRRRRGRGRGRGRGRRTTNGKGGNSRPDPLQVQVQVQVNQDPSSSNAQQQQQQTLQQHAHSTNVNHSSSSSSDGNVKSKSHQPINLDNYEPAQHLTPQDWNHHLLQDARKSSSAASASASAASASSKEEQNQDHNSNDSIVDGGGSVGGGGGGEGGGAILIDARNVYESNIGHFSIPNIPTLLTNTRKYSTIPAVLKASIPKLAGKNVYMYCTGGVRCERASVYLQALAESDEWPDDVEKPKAIYQLQGGIQKYLETYGKKEGQGQQDGHGGGSSSSSSSSSREDGGDKLQRSGGSDDDDDDDDEEDAR